MGMFIVYTRNPVIMVVGNRLSSPPHFTFCSHPSDTVRASSDLASPEGPLGDGMEEEEVVAVLVASPVSFGGIIRCQKANKPSVHRINTTAANLSAVGGVSLLMVSRIDKLHIMTPVKNESK